jgi:hypothetical protein
MASTIKDQQPVRKSSRIAKRTGTQDKSNNTPNKEVDKMHAEAHNHTPVRKSATIGTQDESNNTPQKYTLCIGDVIAYKPYLFGNKVDEATIVKIDSGVYRDDKPSVITQFGMSTYHSQFTVLRSDNSDAPPAGMWFPMESNEIRHEIGALDLDIVRILKKGPDTSIEELPGVQEMMALNDVSMDVRRKTLKRPQSSSSSESSASADSAESESPLSGCPKKSILINTIVKMNNLFTLTKIIHFKSFHFR